MGGLSININELANEKRKYLESIFGVKTIDNSSD